VLTVASLTLLLGCPGREVSKVDPKQSKEQENFVPVQLNRDVDILFVIDNSGSMAEEQASLAANFNRFINVLEAIEGGLPNVHIGVISTDVGAGPFGIQGCNGNGDNGSLQSAPQVGGCSPPSGAFIQDLDDGNGGRITNYDTTQGLADTFSCVARLGIGGCGFEQPLESMRRALNGSNPSNANFLRDSAFLAVIIISDEDDCSAEDTGVFDTGQTGIGDPLGPLSSFRCFEFGVECEPDDPRTPGPRMNCASREDSQFMFAVQEYIDFLRGLKADPSQVLVAGIIGNPTPVNVGSDAMTGNPVLEPSCVSGSGEAAPGVRLNTFLSAFPQRNTITTICNDDLSDALTLIAELLRKVIGNPCLDGNLRDIDDATAGVQPNCVVADVQNLGLDNQVESIIPECADNGGATPCVTYVIDTANCSDTPTQLSMEVMRGNDSVPPNTTVVARCEVAE
jgi:hypothetical protein